MYGYTMDYDKSSTTPPARPYQSDSGECYHLSWDSQKPCIEVGRGGGWGGGGLDLRDVNEAGLKGGWIKEGRG